MPYQVLARKWRPQTFDEVVGQHHITRTLQNAIRAGRVAHAYLFTGARGVGKTSVARILAKALNCLSSTDQVPCNACSNCREITQSQSVDVLEIDGASNRGIDNVRELRETVRYRPAKSRYKIYIIDEVHMLTTEAFNALLKTLEEPPGHVLFLFATTEPHKIPATILSRCQRFDFRRIAVQELVKHLKLIAAKEAADVPDTLLYALAREAEGSMRDAQSLLEQVLAFMGEDLSGEELLDILGIVDRQSVYRVASAILDHEARTCLEVVSDIYRRGIDIKRFCNQLCDCFRNLLVLALAGPDSDTVLDLPREETAVMRDMAGKASVESLHLIFQMLVNADEEIRRSSLPRTTLEMLLLRLTRLPDLRSLDELIQKLDALEKKQFSPVDEKYWQQEVEQKQTPFSEPGKWDRKEVEAVEAPVLPLDPQEVVSKWPAFLRYLKVKDPILAAKLGSSRVSHISENRFNLEVLDIFHDSVKDKTTLAGITKAVKAFIGHECHWVVKAKVTPSADPQKTHKAGKGKSGMKRAVLEDPIVLQALDILGGELSDVQLFKSEDLPVISHRLEHEPEENEGRNNG